MPDHFQKLDLNWKLPWPSTKKGRNIKAAEADSYIAGYMIMNDMSARTLQMEEMLLNLGPAKGKDFSTVIGPWLVTPDELEPYKIAAKPGHTGNNYNLAMKCHVNGKQVSYGNMGRHGLDLCRDHRTLRLWLRRTARRCHRLRYGRYRLLFGTERHRIAQQPRLSTPMAATKRFGRDGSNRIRHIKQCDQKGRQQILILDLKKK